MIEFADIFAYDLSSMVFIVGTSLLLTLSLLTVAWANHVPGRGSAFELAPAFGM